MAEQTTARALGTLMCDTTRTILWAPAEPWLRQQSTRSSLHCRVGSGQATYHRFDPQRKQHQITYGIRMIVAKHEAHSAAGWLSGREIQQRGYFGGELTTLNLLAHTCCHEFAHLLQHNAGKRFRGSVHNRHFYKILDQLHASGGAEAARDYLQRQAEQAGIELPHQRFESPHLRQLAANWQVGDSVQFGSGRRQHRGDIIRVNRKTCTVEGTGPSRGLRYRVPVSLLSRADPAPAS
ncbi:hypothetical protein [Marinobacter sp. M-5]|uniref:hypothetical protein n=1 Tax=Marinobacter sp. M-5 TaxID=3081089 RepID=UPI00293CD8B2|nr:hypothetical protein [Marinobacter sp. M-5]MDV3504440.1 hypothetical protein [Marinobacter sp. M-5]